MKTKNLIVTKESLSKMINRASVDKQKQIVGRALVVMFNNQTESEKATDSTREQNGEGFASMDSYTGSLTAKYFLKHRTIQDWQLKKWLKPQKNGYYRICKYHRQLNEAALKRRGLA